MPLKALSTILAKNLKLNQECKNKNIYVEELSISGMLGEKQFYGGAIKKSLLQEFGIDYPVAIVVIKWNY